MCTWTGLHNDEAGECILDQKMLYNSSLLLLNQLDKAEPFCWRTIFSSGLIPSKGSYEYLCNSDSLMYFWATLKRWRERIYHQFATITSPTVEKYCKALKWRFSNKTLCYDNSIVLRDYLSVASGPSGSKTQLRYRRKQSSLAAYRGATLIDITSAVRKPSRLRVCPELMWTFHFNESDRHHRWKIKRCWHVALGVVAFRQTLLWSDMLFEIRQQKVKDTRGQKTSQSSNDYGQNNSRHFSNKVSLNVINTGYELKSLNQYTCTVIYSLLTPERHEQTKQKKKRSKKEQSRWVKVSFKPSF